VLIHAPAPPGRYGNLQNHLERTHNRRRPDVNEPAGKLRSASLEALPEDYPLHIL
jgi:hypothetical protein